MNSQQPNAKFSLVIPFHNRDYEKLFLTVRRWREQGLTRGVMELLLCHNGPAMTDEIRVKLQGLVSDKVQLLTTTAKGIGAGYRLGIAAAKYPYVILSASDLPFGWTDLEAFVSHGRPEFAIGSKAHPQSSIRSIRWHRRVISICFYLLRCLLLGFTTPKDSQGSFIIQADLARKLCGLAQFQNYMFTLEISTLHLKQGGKIVELPIVLENNEGESSVSVSRDGLQMFRDLILLRGRILGRAINDRPKS